MLPGRSGECSHIAPLMHRKASKQMGDAAITCKGGTRDYWVRGASPHVVNFAKGVLIGGIVVISFWLLLG